MNTKQQRYQTNPEIEEAINELKGMVITKYPNASFVVFEGEDPEGVYLEATVDVEDTDEVMDLVVDRLLTMQVEEGLPVHFLTARPLERVLEELHEKRFDVLDRLWEKAEPNTNTDPEEVEKLVNDEVHALRRDKRAQPKR